ncbi:Histone deacetylase hda1 [Thoreauomyces humboldtii]|nr:Histone deacetylase hda1 [Thoreauomyces humboldtii]
MHNAPATVAPQTDDPMNGHVAPAILARDDTPPLDYDYLFPEPSFDDLLLADVDGPIDPMDVSTGEDGANVTSASNMATQDDYVLNERVTGTLGGLLNVPQAQPVFLPIETREVVPAGRNAVTTYPENGESSRASKPSPLIPQKPIATNVFCKPRARPLAEKPNQATAVVEILIEENPFRRAPRDEEGPKAGEKPSRNVGVSSAAHPSNGVGNASAILSSSDDSDDPAPMLKRRRLARKTTVSVADAPQPSLALPSTETGLLYDPRFLNHRNLFCDANDSNAYPEKPERVETAYKALQEEGLVARCKKLDVRAATVEELRLVHSEAHIQKIKTTAGLTKDLLEKSQRWYNDVYISEETAEVATLSCGGAITVAKAAITRSQQKPCRGFCIYNNVSVAAKVLQKLGAKRILLLDWDIHHGNGTQRVFYDDPNVLYISIHRYDNGEFFPHLTIGGVDFIGGDKSKGRNVNVPWPCGGMSDADYAHAFHALVMPIAYEFQPEIVLVSAGFDAAQGDPLGECRVTPAGYAFMTHQLMALAGGKVVICMEGGYHIPAVSKSLIAVTATLLGDSQRMIQVGLGPSPLGRDAVQRAREVHSPYWKCLGPMHVDSDQIRDDERRTSVPIYEVLAGYRKQLLREKYHLELHTILNADLCERFKGQIHVSANLARHSGFLFIFAHSSFEDVRLRLKPDRRPVCRGNLSMSIAGLKPILVQLAASNEYLENIVGSGHALIDIDIDTGQLGETQAAHIVKEVTKYMWDALARDSPASRVFLIGVDAGASGLANLVAIRPAARERTQCVVMLASRDGMVPSVHASCEGWYLESSRVYSWSDSPEGESLTSAARNGRRFSAGPARETSTSSCLMTKVCKRAFAWIARRTGEAYVRQLEEAAKAERAATKRQPQSPTGNHGKKRKSEVWVEIPARNGAKLSGSFGR